MVVVVLASLSNSVTQTLSANTPRNVALWGPVTSVETLSLVSVSRACFYGGGGVSSLTAV